MLVLIHLNYLNPKILVHIHLNYLNPKIEVSFYTSGIIIKKNIKKYQLLKVEEIIILKKYYKPQQKELPIIKINKQYNPLKFIIIDKKFIIMGKKLIIMNRKF